MRHFFIIGMRPSGEQVRLWTSTTREKAVRQLGRFAQLEGYARITIEEEGNVSGFNGNNNKKTVTLAEARQRTPPPDPVAACRNQLQLALFGAVSEGDVVQMATKLKAMAMEGDLRAMKLFFSLVTGGGGMSTPPAPQVQQQPPQIIYVDARTGQAIPQPLVIIPSEPTAALPETQDKIEVMRQRAERGESLHHPMDARPGDVGGDD